MSGPGLKLVSLPDKPQAKEKVLHVGRRYPLPENLACAAAGTVLADTDVCVGAYRVTPGQAQVVAVDRQGPVHIWSTDTTLRGEGDIDRLWGQVCRLACNHLTVTSAGLDGPFLTEVPNGLSLQMNAEFELEWHTLEQAGALGAVDTVQVQRSVRFVDGGSQVLLDTGTSKGQVRYVHPGGGDHAINPICSYQPVGEQARHRYVVPVQQLIPEQIDGRAVSEVTVMEQYTSHFMQCEDPSEPERYIWVPLILPMNWGWSIRVGRRTDGEWGILRRKLMLPACGDELVLPVWQSDTDNC